jgi:tripartite-type tricarboxylate transporter receptor subunit TctC
MRRAARKLADALASIAIAATAAFAAAAAAQDYPTKPIRIVVGFPPGGVVDIAARQLAPKMSETLGQPIIIDNRAGAGGSIATESVARSAPDGYTAMMVFDTHAVNPYVYKNLRFDTFKDFAPVSLVANIPLVIAATPAFPPNTIAELVAAAKAKPGAVSYGTVGAGSSGHLAAEQFELLAGIDLLHVPFKGGGPAVTALLGEQVQLLVFAAGAGVPHLRSGKMKGLAVTGKQRSPALPNIPTMTEAGYPQLDSGAWMGLVVPAGTPDAVIAKLHAATVKAIKDPDVAAKLADQAVELVGSRPDEFGVFIRAQYEKWGKLIREAKLNLEQ